MQEAGPGVRPSISIQRPATLPAKPGPPPVRCPWCESTPLSDAVSAELRRRGFNLVGSTIVYVLMQAAGMVNDHLVLCFRPARRG